MKGLWFESRRRWEAKGQPTIGFDISRAQREALLKSNLARFVARTGDEEESDDGSIDSGLTEVDESGEEGEDADMTEG